MLKSRPIYHQRQLACERSYSNMYLKMYGGLGPAINSQNYHKLNSNGNNELPYIPYILAYKSQNLRQNLNIIVGGATYTRVIKQRIFPATEIRNFRPCKATRQRPIHRRRAATAAAALSFLPVVHCRFGFRSLRAWPIID